MLGPRTRAAAVRATRTDQVEQQHDDDNERKPKRPKELAAAQAASTFRIPVVTMAGAVIAIEDASAADLILSVKERVFALNSKLRVRRQRLVYTAGPHGMDPLADDETLGGAGVVQDGSAELDVLLVDWTAAEMSELGVKYLHAAKNGCAKDLLELLDEGADKDAKDVQQNSALILAAKGGHVECVRLLLKIETVRLLVEAGADKGAKDHRGNTALAWAAELGKADCVHLLAVGDNNAAVKGRHGVDSGRK